MTRTTRAQVGGTTARFNDGPNADLDERDAAICAERIAARARIGGPRVGDYVLFGNGETRRFTYDHDEYGLQTGMWGPSSGSYYLSPSGQLSYSGGLDPCVKRETLTESAQTLDGPAWFFHHDYPGAGRGVACEVPCRLYTSSLEAAP